MQNILCMRSKKMSSLLTVYTLRSFWNYIYNQNQHFERDKARLETLSLSKTMSKSDRQERQNLQKETLSDPKEPI